MALYFCLYPSFSYLILLAFFFFVCLTLCFVTMAIKRSLICYDPVLDFPLFFRSMFYHKMTEAEAECTHHALRLENATVIPAYH